MKKRKISYFGHIYRNDKYNILQLILEGKIDGKRGRGRRRFIWLDNIKKWTNVNNAAILARMAKSRREMAKVVADVR